MSSSGSSSDEDDEPRAKSSTTLDADEFDAVLRIKAVANKRFAAGELDVAALMNPLRPEVPDIRSR